MDARDDGHWHLVVGDPTPLGWLTFAAYLLVALTCWRAAQAYLPAAGASATASQDTARPQRHLRRWWLGMAALMLLLGLNKQLDLQTLLTDIGRDMALAQGWYGSRKQVQMAIVAALALVLGAGGLAAAIALRHVLRQIVPALLGLALILAFIVLRAAAFHVLRAAPGTETLPSLWLLEWVGIGLIALNARRSAHPTLARRR